MDAILWEWLSLLVRWTHVIAGVAWIGSSFYFIHLDLSLEPREGLPDGAQGEAWQVHGGGFYHMVKYRVAPEALPERLTWFKWEAYSTWASGALLLVIVYYCGAELYLIDPAVLAIGPAGAVALSVAGIAGGWLVYDALCRSSLGRSDRDLALAGFVLLVAMAFGYSLLFSGRGAFMQMGAVIGTIMVANVFRVIIPNQKIIVAELIAGRTPDPALGARGKQRSLHNNYLTLPVVYVMIGNHYPLAYASPYAWAMLALVLVIGAAVRHFFNTRHKRLPSPWWTWGVAAVAAALIVWLSTLGAPATAEQAAQAPEPAPAGLAEEASLAVENRCVLCHARAPQWPGMASPPKGVVLETPDDLRRHADGVRVAAVLTHAMPPGNLTAMTQQERETVGAWLDSVDGRRP